MESLSLSEGLKSVADLLARRRIDDAVDAAGRVVGAWPASAEAHFLQAVGLAEQSRLEVAEQSLRRAVSLRDGVPPWNWRLLMVNLLRDQNKLVEAADTAKLLAESASDRPEAHNALGLVLLALGRAQDAIASFRRAVDANPKYLAAYRNMAAALVEGGRAGEALGVLHQGLTELPGNADLHVALGKAFEAMLRPRDAKAAYAAALRAAPGASYHALSRYGRLCYEEADIFSAISAYEAALKLQPDDVELWIRLGNAYLDVGAVARAAHCFDEALRRKPDYREVYDTALVCMHYDATIGPEEMYEAHLEWAKRFAARASRAPVASAGDMHGRRIRLGFVSRSLGTGAVRYFLPPLLRHLDKARFTTYCYGTGPVEAQALTEIASLCDAMRDSANASDDELVAVIQGDAIDVLVDLDGHVPGNRLGALSRKPAAIQVSWLDYFDTTGCEAFDVLIGDTISTPVGGAQRFVERVVRVDPCRLCYEPPAYAPAVAPPPVLRNGFITLGSFNRLSKLAEPLLNQWSRLLDALPTARLLLKNGAFAHENTRAVFAQRFALRGIGLERIELRGPSPHGEMLSDYGDVDIAIDPMPYNGGLTTCEALWMGVPVVAMCGESMISRQGAALLTAAQLPQWIFHSWDEWLDGTVALASNPPHLAAHRLQARVTLAQSPLVDGRLYAQKFGDIVLKIVASGSRGRE